MWTRFATAAVVIVPLLSGEGVLAERKRWKKQTKEFGLFEPVKKKEKLWMKGMNGMKDDCKWNEWSKQMLPADCDFEKISTRKRPECFFRENCGPCQFDCEIILEPICPAASDPNRKANEDMPHRVLDDRIMRLESKLAEMGHRDQQLLKHVALLHQHQKAHRAHWTSYFGPVLAIVAMVACAFATHFKTKGKAKKDKAGVASLLFLFLALTISIFSFTTFSIFFGFMADKVGELEELAALTEVRTGRYEQPAPVKKYVPNYFELNKSERDAICEKLDGHILNIADEKKQFPRYLEVDTTWETNPTSNWDNLDLKFLALHFPQWYPAPENGMLDDWRYFQNPKFTHNYLGHPFIRPKQHAYYDQRCKNVRATQAALAQQYLVDGFIYYYYWFNNTQFLPEVNQRQLRDGEPNIDFCYMLVNEDWGRTGAPFHAGWDYTVTDELVDSLASFFKHPRYIHIQGRPLLYMYRIKGEGEGLVTNYLDELAAALKKRHNIPRPYTVGSIQRYAGYDNEKSPGFDTYTEFGPNIHRLYWSYGYTKYNWTEDYHLSLTTRFDNSPRGAGGDPNELPASSKLSKGRFLSPTEETPTEFRERCTSRVAQWAKYQHKERIVNIFAFNEWSEQASLEPSDLFGYQYLEAIRDCKLEALRQLKQCGMAN